MQTSLRGEENEICAGYLLGVRILIVALDGREFQTIPKGIVAKEARSIWDWLRFDDLISSILDSLSVGCQVIHFEADMMCRIACMIGGRGKMQLHFSISGGEPDDAEML